jgi:hypothetical protein
MHLLGLTPPAGEGYVVEVHLDMQNDHPSFATIVGELGFEDDPFEVFFPAGYQRHMTGRIRTTKKKLPIVIPQVRDLVDHVVTEAKNHDVDLYAEIEIVREKQPFITNDSSVEEGVLDGIDLQPTDQFGGADADIHLKFRAGTVSSRVRAYLESKCFYWVMTPATELFPSKEIATLQTDSLGGAKLIYRLLLETPFANALGIQLEQKLGMVPTRKDLPMPRVIKVVR